MSLGPTLAALLQAAIARLADTDSPRLDAEVLLAHVLGRNRAYLRTWPEREATPEQAQAFHALIERRATGEPIAYLIGEREFWSRNFRVRPGVLIPRPDTELLVELALKRIPTDRPVNVIDLGTGSGIIAVTLAAERPLARVTATDTSPEALAIARKNAAQHEVTIHFAAGDWFAAVAEDQRFDLVASNPPYIADHDPHLSQGDLRFEPSLALSSGPEGLDALSHIAETARERLTPGGWLLLEHGYDQAPALAECLTAWGYTDIAHHPDLQGHPRVTVARWRPAPTLV